MNKVKLYHLPPSPNNVKVRLALGLKKIPAELVAIDPTNRGEIVRLSGQPLTPILLDGDRVVYDSYGILRYLDANWPSEPRLFDADRTRMKEIEGWEMFARTQIGESVSLMFGQFFAQQRDPAALERARKLLDERAGKLEDALASNAFLMGAAPNAADLSVAAMLSVCVLDPTTGPEGSLPHFFGTNLQLPKRFARTHAWLARVLAYDVARG